MRKPASALPSDRSSGMELRDYFAAKVIASLVSPAMNQRNALYVPRDMAQTAYEIADAMMAERTKAEAAE